MGKLTHFDRGFHGAYTPASSALANLEAATPAEGIFRRTGNLVEAWVPVTLDATAAGAFSFELALPVASDFTGVNDCMGGVFGSSESFKVTSSVTNNTAVVSGVAVSTASGAYTVYFAYKVK